jgi:hypothetical protein
MSNRNITFLPGEWYHCYNRSIEKRISFEDKVDYERFLELLYLANDDSPLRRGDIGQGPVEEVLRMPRGKRLVSISAFCLMQDHFHLVLKEVAPQGISSFMRKIGTAYAMYFNAKYARQGNLFLKPFQASHVPNDSSLTSLISYVHAGPATLYEPKWRAGIVIDPQLLEEQLVGYRYSSLGAYRGVDTSFSPILDVESPTGARTLPMQRMLREAREYGAHARIP